MLKRRRNRSCLGIGHSDIFSRDEIEDLKIAATANFDLFHAAVARKTIDSSLVPGAIVGEKRPGKAGQDEECQD